eukprot:TRINITY_DN74712_c0_g1_i1.p1 TRINITY_DN74712_c0_g1~~TRINITY_DN74712_c0_g1_i1.p1  ORF type:complete len:822 (+),score=256.24 TRINITY_DN74712_c0_g1_i1:182-2647(+)
MAGKKAKDKHKKGAASKSRKRAAPSSSDSSSSEDGDAAAGDDVDAQASKKNKEEEERAKKQQQWLEEMQKRDQKRYKEWEKKEKEKQKDDNTGDKEKSKKELAKGSSGAGKAKDKRAGKEVAKKGHKKDKKKRKKDKKEKEKRERRRESSGSTSSSSDSASLSDRQAKTPRRGGRGGLASTKPPRAPPGGPGYGGQPPPAPLWHHPHPAMLWRPPPPAPWRPPPGGAVGRQVASDSSKEDGDENGSAVSDEADEPKKKKKKRTKEAAPRLGYGASMGTNMSRIRSKMEASLRSEAEVQWGGVVMCLEDKVSQGLRTLEAMHDRFMEQSAELEASRSKHQSAVASARRLKEAALQRLERRDERIRELEVALEERVRKFSSLAAGRDTLMALTATLKQRLEAQRKVLEVNGLLDALEPEVKRLASEDPTRELPALPHRDLPPGRGILRRRRPAKETPVAITRTPAEPAAASTSSKVVSEKEVASEENAGKKASDKAESGVVASEAAAPQQPVGDVPEGAEATAAAEQTVADGPETEAAAAVSASDESAKEALQPPGAQATVTWTSGQDFKAEVRILPFLTWCKSEKLWFTRPAMRVVCDGPCGRRYPQAQGWLLSDQHRSQFMQDRFVCLDCCARGAASKGLLNYENGGVVDMAAAAAASLAAVEAAAALASYAAEHNATGEGGDKQEQDMEDVNAALDAELSKVAVSSQRSKDAARSESSLGSAAAASETATRPAEAPTAPKTEASTEATRADADDVVAVAPECAAETDTVAEKVVPPASTDSVATGSLEQVDAAVLPGLQEHGSATDASASPDEGSRTAVI